MTDIIAFISARLDEDELIANWAITLGQDLSDAQRADAARWMKGGIPFPTAQHIARHDPAHVLAEVKAKRVIVDSYRALEGRDPSVGRDPGSVDDTAAIVFEIAARETLLGVLKALAMPFAEHPDYDPAWTLADG